MSAIFQCVWPITDENLSRSELIAEATGLLEGLADRAHAVITGPPLWDIRPAADVIGWHAYAPGLVLICMAPAEDVRAAPLRLHDIDTSEVEVALERNTLPRRAADRYEVVRRLHDVEGRDYDTIADRTGMGKTAINQVLVRVRRRQRAVTAA